jgi:hypothetical protein
MRSSTKAIPFVLAGLALPALGQYRIVHLLEPEAQRPSFGISVSDAGDVNGDGTPDLIVGHPNRDNPDDDFSYPAGAAHVFSGVDGSLLYTFYGTSPEGRFGYSVSGAGDTDGDGFDDLVVGAPYHGYGASFTGLARVFSGRDGSVLFTSYGDSLADQLGHAVSEAGDVDDDGFDDIIVGAPGDDVQGDASGSARVISGVNGAVIHTFNGLWEDDQLGRSVGSVGDVDQDGHDDLIVGTIRDQATGLYWGNARVFSGADASLLFAPVGDDGWDNFGISVSGAGDVNGDAVPDFIVGDNLDATGGVLGSATVFSGQDGSILHIFSGNGIWDGFGESVSGAGDVDGDGFDDLVVGARNEDVVPGQGTGFARVYSGLDGSVLMTVKGASYNDALGTSVSGAGDVDGDGLDEVIIGVPGPLTSASMVLSGNVPPPFTAFCFGDGGVTPCPCDNHDATAGCANSSGQGALLGASGSSSLSNDDLLLDLDSYIPGSPALLFTGANQPNGGYGFAFGDGLRCVGGGVRRMGVKVADGTGRARWGPGLSSGTSWMAGMASYLQVWYRDPGASPCNSEFNLSNGLAVFFLP